MSGGGDEPAGQGGNPDVAGDGGLEKLAECLDHELVGLGAHAGAVYTLDPGEQVLELMVIAGLPQEFVGPWERVGLSAPIPVSDALRSGDTVWVSSAEAMMHRYPRIALAVPYDFAVAAVPVTGSPVAEAAVLLLWPSPQPSRLPERLNEGLENLASHVAKALELSAAAGHTFPPEPGHPVRPLVRNAPSPGPGTAWATERMVARLPEGVFALDLHGRVTSMTPTAARLLGERPGEVVGSPPWEVLPWLQDPLYDRYRAAVISRRPTSDIGLRPPDQWLSFDLFPDASGVSVRVTPARVAGGPPAQGSSPPAHVRAGPGAPARAPEAAEPPVTTRTGALYHVLHLATALTEAISVRDVVELVAEQIMPAYGAQAVAMLSAEGGRLHVVGHRGFPRAVIERYDDSPRFSFTPGARALASGRPSFFESGEELDRAFPHRQGAIRGSMASWAFLPLIASGRPIGVCVLAYARSHHFTTTERAVLTSLGGLIAQALDRARLYDKKLELAHGLQAGLLPHALPGVRGLEAAARYLPGTEGMDIGGDFYDLIRLGSDAAAAVIGDVQGHNVTAAALMGQIRTAVHAFATADADPGQVLASANQLLADLDLGLFASCAYLLLDLGRGIACLANAGHPYPLVRTPGGTVQPLRAPGGLVLGVEADGDYPQAGAPLPPGTTIALYTDGLIEVPGLDFDEAIADLAAELERDGDRPLEDLADLLVRRAHTARHRTDDIALLLIRSVR